MITKEELSEVKYKRKISLYYAEKEYLQYIFLNAISKQSDNFVFKGGTCLRICYGLERASEDLDFSCNMKLAELGILVANCLKDFDLLAIPFEIYSKKEYQGNIRFEIRFKGPLYSGNKNSTNTLKIDFNKQKVHTRSVRVVPQLFSDVPLFTLIALEEKEILAEKIRALINRKEPRDMYDLWMLSKKGAEIDKKLIKLKLSEERANLSDLMFPSKKDYELGLKDLTLNLPTYDEVKRDLEVLFKGL